MRKKYYKILAVFIVICTFLSLATINASALSWDGSSTGGGGSGYAAGPNGYAIRTTGDNCIGYRFSIIDKYGNNKVSKVIDVFRNTSYGNLGYSSGYKFTTKYNKKQLINNQNNGFSTSSNTSNCYKEANMGFASALPTPSGIGTWQNNINNLNPILSTLGAGNIDSLVNGDKIIVEPLYDIRLQSIYHSITVTETALYGKWILGASSNGGSSYTSETWGFIASYTNRHYPNSLYTTDGQGLWTGATAIGSTTKATFYNIINSGYGVGIAYTETKPDFSPTLSVNICEAWPGAKGNRVSHYGISYGNSFGNFSYANGYPTKGNSIWFALNFPSESQTIRVSQSVRLQGGSWTTRIVNLSNSASSSMWFDVSLSPTTVDNGRTSYIVEAKQDWIDGNNNILKYGAVKSFYIPIKPKINRYQVNMYDITGTSVARNGATGLSGAVYAGQRAYPKYTYTSENTWTSSNYLRGATYAWTNNAWNTVYPLNGGSDLYADNQGININSPWERYSNIGLYTVPDNSANNNGSNRIPFKLWTHWASDINNTAETTWIDIPIVKADVELKEIRLIDENNYYVVGNKLYPNQKVIPQYVYKNNTNINIFVEGYNSDGTRISGIYAIPPNGEIYVNGKQITIPNQTSYYFWGGVYLDGAGIYNTGYETNGSNNSKLISYSVEHPLKIEFITPNASYRENTEVVTSFKIINSASIDFYPSSNVSVRFTAYKGSTLVYSGTKSNVVVPANSDNLVYFKWLVPGNLNLSNITLLGEVMQNGVIFNAKATVHNTSIFTNSITPDTRFEKSAPSDFLKTSPPVRSGMTNASWSEWVYENNAFVKKTYGLAFNTVSKPSIVPDVNSPSRKYTGLWYMGSGYGFTASWSIQSTALSGTLYPLSTAFTGAQVASIYLPEYKYSTVVSKYRNLERIATNSFALQQNPFAPSSARLHYVPLWFPDGIYYAQGYVSDLWTPAGMMSAYMNSNPLIISKSAYDDWYLGR